MRRALVAVLVTCICVGCSGGSDGSSGKRLDDDTSPAASGGSAGDGGGSDADPSKGGGKTKPRGGSDQGGSAGSPSEPEPTVGGNGGDGPSEGTGGSSEATVPNLEPEEFVPVTNPMLSRGWVWYLTYGATASQSGVTSEIVALGESLGCYSGIVGSSAKYSSIAGMDINHDDTQESQYAPPALSVGGVQAKVRDVDPPDLDLRLVTISKMQAGDMVYWCSAPGTPVDGSTVSWSSFNYGCPDASGPAYVGQTIHAIVIGVYGREGVETPYRFCIDSLKIIQ